ncbi:hypothetical protein D3C80_1623640 [compost metagenome]
MASISLISLAIEVRSASLRPPLPAWIASSLARCRASLMVDSTLSSCSRAFLTVVMLPLYCSNKALCCCSTSKRAAPTGSSPADWMRDLEVTCSVILAKLE